LAATLTTTFAISGNTLSIAMGELIGYLFQRNIVVLFQEMSVSFLKIVNTTTLLNPTMPEFPGTDIVDEENESTLLTTMIFAVGWKFGSVIHQARAALGTLDVKCF